VCATAYLATLVFIGANYKFYMPPVKDIWQRYLRKFTKQGKLLENDLGLEVKVESNRPRPRIIKFAIWFGGVSGLGST
jgi:hypothetical protein